MQHKEGDTPSPRALRQRGAVDYREDNVELDSMLGLGPPGSKPVKRIDVRLLRRKLEQGCTASDLPASPISDLHTQIFDKGFRRPLVVRATAGGSMNGTRQALGLSLPPAIFSAEGLATAVGGDTIIPTFDVHTQDTGPRMNLRQLAEYFATPAKERAKLINVVSFSLADTALQPHIVAPRVVQELDLVRAVWPENERPRPETLLYSLLGPQGAYTDWHVDMGGSSVWYHVLKGCKVFLAAPPTPKNLTTFESWASSEQQLTEFLGDSLEHCVRVSLHAGDTLLLPSGWPHAVSTPEDSVVVGGNFLHGMDYANIAETFRREERLAVAPKFQFPLFKALMWHAARAALDQLKRALRRKRPPEAAGLSVWELQGLPRLVGLLREWKGGAGGSRRGGAPDCIPDPEDFLQDMESSLAAAGIRDVDCDNEHDGSGAEGGMNVAGDDEFGESEGWQDLDEYTPMLEEGFAPVDMSFLDDMAELFMDQPTDAPPANEPPPSVGSLSALRDPRRPGFVPAPEPSGILMIPLEQPVHDVEEARKPVPAVPDRTARRLAQRAPQRGALEKLKASREIRGNRITKPSATLSSFKARPRNVRAESPPVQLESESESDSGSHWDADEVAKPQKPASMKPKPIKVARPAPPRPYAFAKPIIKPPPAKPKARAPPAVPAPAPDVRPLGRSTAPVAPVAKRPLSATTSRAKPPEADAHAQAMKAISEVQRLRQLVQREESLLAKARSGRVPLKDGGKKLEERLEAQRAELEMKANAVQGRVLSYRDREGKRQGPFTPHQLEAMSREGLVPPGAQIFHKEGRIFSLEEAIALPEPLTATLLRELQAQHAATKSPGTKDPGNGTDDPGVRKAPAGRNSDTDHGALRRMGPPQKRQREWHGERQQPQSQLQLEQPPSAWQVAAQVEALKDAQEAMDIVWTFQHPDTGGYEGPYSTANLRDLFATGYITSNIMVHDEEAGISTKLFTLLGYSSLADGGAGGTPEEEDAPLQDFIPLQGNATLNHMQNLPVGAGVDDEEARWSPVVHRTQPANDWRSEAANAELERRNAHGGDRREELSSWERATRWEAQAEDHQPADIARHSSGGGDGYGFVSHMAVPGQHVGERHAGFGNAYDRYQEQYNQQEYQRGPAQSAYDPHANQAPVSHVNSYSNGGPVPRPMAPHQVGHQAHTRPMVPMRHGPRPMMADQSQTVLPGNAAYDGVELPQPEPQQQARPHNDRKRERERSASFQSHRRNGKWDSEKRSPRHEFTRRWDNSRDRGRDRDRDRDRDHGRHWEREQDKMPDRRKERPREGPKDGYRPPPRSDTHRYRRR